VHALSIRIRVRLLVALVLLRRGCRPTREAILTDMYSSSAIDLNMSLCASQYLRPRDRLSLDESCAPTIFAIVSLNAFSPPLSMPSISFAALYIPHGTIGIL
jgi:hypothetical protein